VDVTLNIAAVNDVPVALEDGPYIFTQDTPLVVPAPGVLANDSDPEGAAVFVSEVERYPYHGALVLNADGSFTYTPDPGYIGIDSFRYKVNDGSLNGIPALVHLHIDTLLSLGPFESGDLAGWTVVMP
jgi:hypothetical protein